MNQPTSQNWEDLHRRFVLGESLTAEEKAAYEAAMREQDEEEMAQLSGSVEEIRALRAQIAEAEAERKKLEAQRVELETAVAALEANLDEKTRQLLGIGN